VLNEFKPDLVHGYGSFLGSFFREALADGLLTHRPRVVLYHSDAMPAADQALIEQELGAALISSYVAAETLFIAFQCEAHRGFHIDIDRLALRLVDPDGRPVAPDGRSEVVVSNLTNRATVLLNYRIGDVATLSEAPCPCGRSLPTLDSIDGRANDELLLSDGTALNGIAIMTALERHGGVVQMQVRQEELRRFVIRAVERADANRDFLATALRRELASLVGGDAAIEVEFLAAIPPEQSGKVRAVVRRPALPPQAG